MQLELPLSQSCIFSPTAATVKNWQQSCNKRTGKIKVSVKCWFTTLFHILAHCCNCANFGWLIKPLKWTLSYWSQSHGNVLHGYTGHRWGHGLYIFKARYNMVSLIIFHCGSIINVSCLTLTSEVSNPGLLNKSQINYIRWTQRVEFSWEIITMEKKYYRTWMSLKTLT